MALRGVAWCQPGGHVRMTPQHFVIGHTLGGLGEPNLSPYREGARADHNTGGGRGARRFSPLSAPALAGRRSVRMGSSPGGSWVLFLGVGG
jgi:hypothetical protein